MADSPDKIQWHPAFYAAAGLELQENINELELIPEYNLSKEPIRIDLLIIKDSTKKKAIKNEIGHKQSFLSGTDCRHQPVKSGNAQQFEDIIQSCR